MKKEKLLIFVKNEEAGKTKTRLAASIGDEEALKVYQKLLKWTFKQTRDLDVTKEVWYSRFTPENDIWDEGNYNKQLQQGSDLGQRMAQAFRQSMKNEGYEKVVIIGSDCAQLTEDIIKEAFDKLESHDFVIGPAEDGGYYLLGMQTFHPEIFEEIEWSTDSVFDETVRKIMEINATFTALQTLNDVDTIEDWKEVQNTI